MKDMENFKTDIYEAQQTQHNPIPQTNSDRSKTQVMVLKWSTGLLAAGMFIANAIVFFAPEWSPTLTTFLLEHYAALVGLPAAAVMSFTVVWMWRAAEGPVEFEFLSLKFTGASGPIIMWVIVFSTIAVAIRLNW